MTYLIMDVDGVLLHHNGKGGRPNWHDTVEEDYGVDPKHFHDHFFGTYWPELVIGKGNINIFLSQYFTTHGHEIDVDEFLLYWHENEVDIDHNLISLCSNLRAQGLSVSLGTNQTNYRADFLWNVLQLKNKFDEMYVSCRIGHRKPEKEFYQEVTKNLAVSNPEEIIFFDDMEENIVAAREYGWSAYLFDGVDGWVDDLSSHGLNPMKTKAA